MLAALLVLAAFAFDDDAVACEALRATKSAASARAYLRLYPRGSCAALAEILAAAEASPTTAPPARTILLETPPGATRPNDGDGLVYAWVPPGDFEMGCVPLEKCGKDSQRRVTLMKGYWFGTTEVTVGAYRRFVDATRGTMPKAPQFDSAWEQLDHPVVNVDWHQASAFCQWAGGRLPTNAEWERAARGGQTGRVFPWGDTVTRADANYGRSDNWTRGLAEGADRWHYTSPVGSFAPNGYGIFDLGGNVWEWVADFGNDKSPGSIDPRGPADGKDHVRRSGSWKLGPMWMHSGTYWSSNANETADDLGFRCVLDGPGELPPPPRITGPVRVGGDILEPRKLVHVDAIYPEIAKQARVQGVVILEATLDPQGSPSDLRVLRSIPLLDQAAIDAVRKWRYAPTLLNGIPVEVILTITVNFHLE